MAKLSPPNTKYYKELQKDLKQALGRFDEENKIYYKKLFENQVNKEFELEITFGNMDKAVYTGKIVTNGYVGLDRPQQLFAILRRKSINADYLLGVELFKDYLSYNEQSNQKG